MGSMARLDAFSCDAICALRATGAKRECISRAFRKKDGKHSHLRAADAVLAKCRANPEWGGTARELGGIHERLPSSSASS